MLIFKMTSLYYFVIILLKIKTLQQIVINIGHDGDGSGFDCDGGDILRHAKLRPISVKHKGRQNKSNSICEIGFQDTRSSNSYHITSLITMMSQHN